VLDSFVRLTCTNRLRRNPEHFHIPSPSHLTLPILKAQKSDHRLFVGQLPILNITDLLPSNGYEEIFLSLAVLGSVVDTFNSYMEEDAIITAVHPATTSSLGKDLEIDSLHVSFRLV
jgi:hypothetical protein